MVPARLPDGRPGGGRAVLVDARLDADARSTSGGGSRSRADLEAVVRIEFDAATADAVLAEHEGTDVDYAVNLWWSEVEQRSLV